MQLCVLVDILKINRKTQKIESGSKKTANTRKGQNS